MMATQTGVVLVVDDDKINRVMLSTQLEMEGHTVFVAEHGRRAIELLHNHKCDIVLLDLLMPEVNGFEVLEQIRASDTLKHLPVIVISAVDEMSSVVRSIQMGATDHLIKPCDPFLLRARISTSLSAKRMHDHEAEYLKQVALLTKGAADLEAGTFHPDNLAPVAARPDALGHLARVFQQMAREVFAREQYLQQQSALKSALIGKITHELRSPFVAAGFSVEVLQRYAQHDMVSAIPEQISVLQRQLTEGRTMIDRIITFASLVGQQTELRLQPTNMADLIQDTTAPLRKLAATRGVKLSYDIAESLPTVLVDQEQIGEAIQHLVHNAIKFNREHGMVVINGYTMENIFFFTVKDTGVGVAPAKLDAIWEAFAQTSDDVRRGVEGLGLGLALVKCVVDTHGGAPFAQSSPGVGSIFGFRIPITPKPICA